MLFIMASTKGMFDNIKFVPNLHKFDFCHRFILFS